MTMEKPKINEQYIQERLRYFNSQPRMFLNNLYVFDWESDVLILTKAVLWYEFEIKISRSDFFSDRKKVGKHEKLSTAEYTRKPNYFYYAVPDGLIKPEECPPHAGLIYVRDNVYDFTIVKVAPKLHSVKNDPNSLSLADKFYFNMVNAKIAQRQSLNEIKDVHRHYADTKAAIEDAKRMTRGSIQNEAMTAFKISCEHIGEYFQCTFNPDKRQRCGWCDKIIKFEELIYKEKP